MLSNNGGIGDYSECHDGEEDKRLCVLDKIGSGLMLRKIMVQTGGR